MKNHRYDESETRKTEHKTLKTKISRNITKVEGRGKKQHKNNIKKVLHITLYWEKAHAIAVESLDIFFQTVPNNNLIQQINWHSKLKQKMYLVIHRRLNRNLEIEKLQSTKEEEYNMPKVSSQQEHNILFNHKLYTIMCWVI